MNDQPVILADVFVLGNDRFGLHLRVAMKDMLHFLKYMLIGWIGFSPGILIGQENQDTLLKADLESVSVISTRLPSSLWSTARSVYKADLQATNRGNQQLALDESLQQLPGVFAINPLNFSQDLRIAIRGFGSRAAFGVRGLKVFVDGIPATTPDGQTQLDHLDMQRMGSLEILNGASAGLYGNASGGVIHINSKEGNIDRTSVSTTIGSFGLVRSNLDVQQVGKKLLYGGGVSYNQIDGYREQSAAKTWETYAYLGQKRQDLDWRLRMSFLESPYAEDPGGINLDQVAADRKSARDQNVTFDGGESIRRGSLAFTYDRKLRPNQNLSFRTYYIRREFENKLPFENGGAVAFDRDFAGVNLQYEYRGSNYKMLTGIDVERQVDQRQRRDNLMGVKGDLTLDQLERFDMVGLFALQEWQATEALKIELTTRLDLLGVKAEDHFISDGDQSGKINWQHFSPSLGISYRLGPSNYLYGRVGHSFETPALSELSANPDGSGGFNEDLNPQTANHFEMGSKGWFGNSLRYQIALFHINLTNELLPFELPDFPGRTFYRNAGNSSRNGIELSVSGNVLQDFSWQAAYTFSDFKFKEYEVDGQNLEGNTLPGIPRHFGNLALRYGGSAGLYVFTDIKIVGKLYANDNNMTEVPGYTLIHPRAGWTQYFNETTLDIHVGLRNVTNVDYFDNIRINAFGGRFYEPAPGTHFFVGAELVF